MGKLLHEDLTYKVIGAAQEVHRVLGPGYLESVYEDALCHELDELGIPFERQVDLDVHYKNVVFRKKFRADLVIAGKVLVENKASNGLAPQDEAQLINYLKTTGVRVGLLFNFGGPNLEMLRRVL